MTIRDGYPTVKKPERFDPARTTADKAGVFPPLAAEVPALVGYVRTGGCTPGCGACCESFVVPISEEGWAHEDWRGVVHDQIVLPIDPVVKDKAGMADWENWLTLHEVFLFRSPGCNDSSILTVVVPIKAKGDAPIDSFENWMTWIEGHGVAFIRRQDHQLAAYVPVSCTKLNDGMCTIVGTEEHPKMCARYPRHPMDVEGLNFCTYKFKPISANQVAALPLHQTFDKPKRKKGKRKKNGRRKNR